jgi:ABC-type transport system substrate-binding protein
MFRMARPTYNESGYWHPSTEGNTYIAMYKKAMMTGDSVKRREIYYEMQSLLQREVPSIFLTGRREIIVHRKNVRGLKAHSQYWGLQFSRVWRS